MHSHTYAGFQPAEATIMRAKLCPNYKQAMRNFVLENIKDAELKILS
jgi:hypothetical protein